MQDEQVVMFGEFVSRKGVSLERLQTLCLVVEAGTIMSAAKGDPNRQSLFSRQIKELEQALQLELLDRSSLPHRPTPEATRLEGMTREFLAGVERLLAESAARSPIISIGAGESIIQWLLLPLLTSGAAVGHRIRFQNLTSRETVEAIRARRVDIGVVPAEDAARDLSTIPIASYGVVVIGPKGEFPSRRVDWGQMEGRGLVVLEGRSALRRRIDALIGSGVTGPEIQIECTSYPQVIEACASGRLIGLLPEIATPAAKKAGLEAWRVAEPVDFQIDLALMWSPAIVESKAEVARLIRRLGGRP